MNYGFIYETTNLKNGKKYIGSHKRSQDPNDPDDSWYLGSGALLWKAIHKYGKENFSRRILMECYSQKDLEEKETQVLMITDAANSKFYYNIMPSFFGGTSKGENSPMYGKHHSEETKEKIGTRSGDTRTGLPLSDSHRANISKSLSTDANRQRQSELMKGTIAINNGEIEKRIRPEELDLYESQGWEKGRLPITLSEESKEALGYWKGKTQSEETVKKRVETVTGMIALTKDNQTIKVHPEEVNGYLAQGWTKGMSEEFREMRSKNVKGKIHIYLGEEQKFLTPEEAESYLSKGWQRGFPEYQRKKLAESAKIREANKRKKLTVE